MRTVLTAVNVVRNSMGVTTEPQAPPITQLKHYCVKLASPGLPVLPPHGVEVPTTSVCAQGAGCWAGD